MLVGSVMVTIVGLASCSSSCTTLPATGFPLASFSVTVIVTVVTPSSRMVPLGVVVIVDVPTSTGPPLNVTGTTAVKDKSAAVTSVPQ